MIGKAPVINLSSFVGEIKLAYPRGFQGLK